MAKYGRGLNREIVSAVNRGIINEPFTIDDVKIFVQSNNWSVPDNYLNVCLSNGSSAEHSQTYKKYFVAMGSGSYQLASLYRGDNWR